MQKEKVILIGVQLKNELKDSLDSLKELERLSNTAQLDVVKVFSQTLIAPNSATYVGTGKLKEIAEYAERCDVKTIIFDDDLSPSQARKIQQQTALNVVDRTELILDIFAKHARTKLAKMQVELAQLEYSYSRLKNMWKHLSRIQGGIGFRGPGEKQIELDRREIKKKINILKERLKDTKNTTKQNRRKRNNMLNIALVGYTNAGKSTIFNQLVKEDHYAADQLFATLDATTRKIHLASQHDAMLTDTIGFIKKLPHTLIQSFQATLMEVVEADLLIHVVDVTHPDIFSLIESVDNVLNELNVHKKETLMVFNKIDKASDLMSKFLFKKLADRYSHALFISAYNKEDVRKIIEKIALFETHQSDAALLRVPRKMSKLIEFIHHNSNVLSYDYDAEKKEEILEVEIEKEIIPNIEKQIEDFKLMEFIHS